MAEVQFARQVERDLTNIGDTIAEDNPAAATEFIEAIRRHCYLLAATPLMGRARPEIGQEVRSFPITLMSSITGFGQRQIGQRS